MIAAPVELLLVSLIIVFLFGAKRLPAAGHALARAPHAFRAAADEAGADPEANRGREEATDS